MDLGVGMDSETLASRIREAIRASGMSQQSLAETVGMDPTALSKVLSAGGASVGWSWG